MSATLKDLRSCLSVVTNDQSKQLKLETAVLLDGAPKSGKARWVQNAAASVGMHVQVVDAFDLIGDSDTKTEGMLRARFSRAMDSAPCVLLVSHVEALARKSQAMETGQGEWPFSQYIQACFLILMSRIPSGCCAARLFSRG